MLWFSFNSLRARLLWGVGLPLLVLQLLVFLAEYALQRDEARADLIEESLALTRMVAGQIDQACELLALSTRTKAASLAGQAHASGAEMPHLLRDVPKDVVLLNAWTLFYRPLSSRTGDTRYYRVRVESARTEPVLAEAPALPWSERAIESPTPFWTGPYIERESALVSYVVPLTGQGAFQGILGAEVPIERLQALLREAEFEEGRLMLVDPSSGTLLADDDASIPGGISIPRFAYFAERMRHSEPISLHGRSRASLIRRPSDTEGEPDNGASVQLRSTGWQLLAILDEARLRAEVSARLGRSAMAYGIGSFAVLGLLGWMSGRATRPLIPLGRVARRVSQGDLDARVEGSLRSDEIGQFAATFNRMMDDLQVNIAGRIEATEARLAVESELNLALKIQRSLLPPPFPADSGIEIATWFVPARYVAGDFYDHFKQGPETIVLAMADVSGKGIPAAVFMAAARTSLRNFSHPGVSPGAILEAVNRSLAADNDQVMFVTAFLAQLHVPSGRLVYANAGHNLPYLIRTDGSVAPLGDPTGPLLAVLEDARYSEREAFLAEGDGLFLYTDGVVEAADRSGELYGEERLEASLRRLHDCSPENVCIGVAESVHQHCGGDPQDDLTLLMLRRGSRKP